MQKLLLLPLIYLFSATSFAAPIVSNSFAEAEHAAIGNQVKIYLQPDSEGESAHVFKLPSGVIANYGELVTFGDVYGTPGEAISQGDTEKERRRRFINAFNSFAYHKEVVDEANEILAAIHDEQHIIAKEIQQGKLPEDAYKNLKNETARRFNCITGGGCNKDTWWLKSGRYLELAKNDFDHFGANAVLAYQTGHKLAMEEALKAKALNQPQRLEIAYAMNAFACHFLSDRFSTGHIRSPRVELPAHVNPTIVGTILVTYMHNEENLYGLHVHNRLGDRWLAYGDQSYFSDKTMKHRHMIERAMQVSGNQIIQTYVTGTMGDDEEVLDLIPQPDESALNSKVDIAPLFYWDNEKQELLRRIDVANPYDRNWTSDWWGWSTLTLLIQAHGELPGQVQGELAQSEYAEFALQHGFITHPQLISKLRSVK